MKITLLFVYTCLNAKSNAGVFRYIQAGVIERDEWKKLPVRYPNID
jgi:hypothetical protein